MATVKWRLEATWIKSPSCDFGCPCDFWVPPTRHSGDGMFAMKVDQSSNCHKSLAHVAQTERGLTR